MKKAPYLCSRNKKSNMSNKQNNLSPPLEKEILQELILKVRIAIATGHEELLGELNRQINKLNNNNNDNNRN